MSVNSDTIDITALVENTRASFASWAVTYLYTMACAIPTIGPILAFPIVSWIAKGIISTLVNTLSNSAVMMGFFMNTVLRKAAQADDFIKASDALANLPQDVSDADYAKAEAAKMDAFRNFAVLTN